MESVILVIHLILALAIIGLVLIQRSEGGGLGIGGGGMGGLATPKGAANILTRATAICAAAFFCTSLILAIMAGKDSQQRHGILDVLKQEEAPVEQPLEQPQPEQKKEAPAAPISE